VARSRRSRRRRPSRWQRLPLAVRASVLLGSLVVGLGLIELGARDTVGELPVWSVDDPDTVVMTGHATRLWGMREGVKDNAGAQATIGPLGLREPVPPVPRPAGTERVLVLGDSSFFGHGVADDETLTEQLVVALRDRGVTADAVNGAVSGYSVAQSLLLMEDVGWSTEPTLVVSANLWSDNTWDAFHDEDLLRSRKLARGNPLVHSAAFRLFATWAASRLGGGRLVAVRPSEGWPVDKVRRVPPRRFAELLDQLAREAAERGVGFALLKPTNRFLVDTPSASSAPAWGVYYQAQEIVAAHHGTVVADMTPAFTAAFAEGAAADDLFMDLMHPRAIGQRLMAEALADALVAAGWPKRSLIGVDTPADVSALVEQETTPRIDDGGVGSPQRNLFAGVAASRSEDATSGCVPWTVEGTVDADGPATVNVGDPAGRSLGQAVLDRGGTFRIEVCTSLSTLLLTATHGEERVQQTLAPGEHAALNFR